MEDKLLTVVIPVYNKEKNISNTLRSLIRQTNQLFNVLIIDDASTDNSVQIIQQYLDRPNFALLENNSNLGVSKSRNLGIQSSETKFISFLDADDELDDKFVEIMLENIEEYDFKICGHFTCTNGSEAQYNLTETDSLLLDYLKNKVTPNTNSWVISKSYLNRYNMKFDENLNWGEDMLFFSEVILNTNNYFIVKESLTKYNYLSDSNSLSSNYAKRMKWDVEWMNILSSKLIEHDRKKENEILMHYRLPGSLINSLELIYSDVDKEISKEMLNEFYPQIEKLTLCNGLRSLKLFFRKQNIIKKIGGMK